MLEKGQFILAHDLGTSGNKATLYDTDGGCAARRWRATLPIIHRIALWSRIRTTGGMPCATVPKG